MAGDGTPIIIKKKKAHGHAHHGGSWKVAYADFVTAMMAFFMVMWILGLSDESKIQISGYFNDPFGYSKNSPMQRNIVSFHGAPVTQGYGAVSRRVQAIKNRKELAVTKVQTDIERKIEEALRLGNLGRGNGGDPGNGKGGTTPKPVAGNPSVGHVKEALQSGSSSQAASSIRDMLAHVDVTATNEGLRIEFLEDSKRDIFFSSGSAQLKPDALRLIQYLAKVMVAAQAPMRFEGHTDAHPFGNGKGGYSNWDLSTDRAQALRRAMEHDGLPASLVIGVNGYAATRPKIPTDPFAGVNRRVSILIPMTGGEDKDGVKLADLDDEAGTVPVQIRPNINLKAEKAVKRPGERDKAPGFWQRQSK